MPQKDPDHPYLNNLDTVGFTPIFILGLHRSGTSILYKTLTATDRFNPITAYHLIRYHELLTHFHTHTTDQAKTDLTALLHAKGQTDRGIDRLQLTADFPEEYGFLLGHQTIRMNLTPRTLLLFTTLCKKIQYTAQNTRPLLLKNPYDFPNFRYLKAAFPTARFVFIHRHPLKTLSSTLNAWQHLVRTKNPYTEQLARHYQQSSDNPLLHLPLRTVFLDAPELGAVALTATAAKATRYYLTNIAKLPARDYVSITYEQLCSRPQQTLDKILTALGEPPTDLDASTLISPRDVPIDPTIQKLAPYIKRVMRPYCDAFGYTIP